MRALSRSIPLLFALATPAVVRGEPTGPGSSAEAPTSRGLVLASVPEVTQLERTTRATDFAQNHYTRRIAVTIGINSYAGRPWPRLQAAVEDAHHMATLFRAMGFDRVESLTDEAATREGLLDLMEHQIPLMVGERDLVVVFFSGHGATVGGEGYIVPRDASDDLEQTGLSVQRLKESVLRMRSRHTVFLMDACFSGTIFRRADTGEVNTFAYWEAAAQHRVVQILTAGKADELVQETDGWGRFTRAVHAGLAGGADRNHDGVVTTEELASYTDDRVQRETKRRQHPQWGTMEGSGTALFLDVRRLPGSAQPAPPRTRSGVRGLERPLGHIHRFMGHREWARAEKLLRDLMLEHADGELRLLLAEVYLEADTLGNASLIDAELRHAADGELSPEQQRRMLDLRARLDKARRQPM